MYILLRVCGRKRGISSVMRANAHDSSFCGRSLGAASADAPKGFAIALWKPSPDPPNLYDTLRWQIAAALSAAVITTPKQGNAPTSHGREPPKKEPSLFPAALRERGSGGEALLSEKRPLPQNLLTVVFPGGSAREGAFLQKGPLPRIFLSFFTSSTRSARLRLPWR